MKLHLIAAVSALAQAAIPASGSAVELKTATVVREMQASERLIATAVRVGDYVELRRQGVDLMRLFGDISEHEDQAARYHCTTALQHLRNLADDLSYPAEARRVIAAERSQHSFVEHMSSCEVEAGLKPTAEPNLRDGPLR